MNATATQTQTTPAATPFPVSAETWSALMPHERAALARAFGHAPEVVDDTMPHERAALARALRVWALRD